MASLTRQVPGIDHFLLSKVAVHATLESATALAVSHNGVLYIAETDEKKINRIRQVTTSGEISLVAGVGLQSWTRLSTTTFCWWTVGCFHFNLSRCPL